MAQNIRTGSDAALRERLKAEGRFTPADIYIAVDAGNLWLAAQDGLLQPVESEILEQNIPANLRDPQNRWFGLTQRVRTIMYHPERVSPEELSTYEALADPQWRGRLILRPATHSYTQSLVASLIAAHDEAGAEEIIRGWLANEPTLIDRTKLTKTTMDPISTPFLAIF
ncbi:ABC transporter substrate-binding protein [Candidatus Hakubella thermalkaliphila]|uniref:ABC transporter substrate-binding protein n=1 Tax=Candidatus Hakubella thermalkaliphila TaxID=2754717 RepID=UPI0021597474|nr:ABC transporter substrate-binding protein [Candidatus Hakubella thermalkaliphila]